jgi:SAM-dependent methyltransferase
LLAAYARSVAARYDGFASWYDERLLPYTMAASDSIERLLGPGPGRCLDLCCGTGAHLQTLVALGWRVTGVDISEDQLRLARQRAGTGIELIRADAAALPLSAARFDAVVSMFSHTDVDDFRLVVREAARVLRPGGVFIYVGLHPCFEGPHSRYEPEDDVPVLHPGYRESRRSTEAPGLTPDGLWAKVGGTHLPLAELVQALLDAPLTIDRFEEHGDEGRHYPRRIAIRARRQAVSAARNSTRLPPGRS